MVSEQAARMFYAQVCSADLSSKHRFGLCSMRGSLKSADSVDTPLTTLSSLQNLDALHDHLATIYPGMRAPSFRCTDAEKGKGLILHYYSEREGLQDIVIGIIKTVAQQIHGTEIDMKVMNGMGTSDHGGHWEWREDTQCLPVIAASGYH